MKPEKLLVLVALFPPACFSPNSSALQSSTSTDSEETSSTSRSGDTEPNWSSGESSTTTSTSSTSGSTTLAESSGETTAGQGSTRGSSSSGSDAETGGGGTAELRFIHLGVGLASVDLLGNDAGDPLFEEVDYREGSTYLTVPASQLQLEVAVSNSGNAPILDQEVNLSAGRRYTAALLGETPTSTQLVTLLDDDVGIGAGNCRMTIVHANPGAGELDVFNNIGGVGKGPSTAVAQDLSLATFGTVELEADQLLSLGLDTDDDGMVESGNSTADVELLSNRHVNGFFGGPSAFLILQFPDGSLVVRETSI